VTITINEEMRVGKTKIQWTDMSWPVVTGCTPVSEGCRNCYAARMAATRLKHHPRYEGLAIIENGKAKWTGEVRLNHDVLEQPLHWRKPRMVFVASMGDLFHDDVPDAFISKVFRRMLITPRHTFQVLTKRPARMSEYIQSHITNRLFAVYGTRFEWPPANIWLGTSVENQAAADERISLLLQTPAAVRFVSVEPMLSAVDLWPYLDPDHYEPIYHSKLNPTLSWVICGAESGPSARPMDEDWVRDLRDQCVAAGTPFFYKQAIRNGCRVHMPELDGQVWDQFPKCEGKLSGWLGRAGGGR
jgi:protein gp37